MENFIESNVYAKDCSIFRKTVNIKKIRFGCNCSLDVEAAGKSLEEKRVED